MSSLRRFVWVAAVMFSCGTLPRARLDSGRPQEGDASAPVDSGSTEEPDAATSVDGGGSTLGDAGSSDAGVSNPDGGATDGGRPDSGMMATDAGRADGGRAGLPGSVPGVEPESMGHHPPMIDGNGTLYRVTESIQSDGNNPRMIRSTNQGTTWAEVDTGNRPAARDLEGTWQLQWGTTMYLSVANSNRVWFASFNTSDAPAQPDRWVLDEEVVADLNNGSGVVQFSSIARTSDGQFWLFHSGTMVSGRQQIAYRRRATNGTWSASQAIGATTGSWTAPKAVLGKSDVTHLFYKDLLNHQLLWRTLSPSGTLSNATRIDVGGTSTIRISHTNAVVADVAGAEVVTVAYVDGAGALKAVTITNGNVGAPVSITTTPVLEDPSVARHDSPTAHLALDGTTVHALWVDRASGDIYRSESAAGGAWAAPQLVWNSGSNLAWWIYGSVFRRQGHRILAFTYDRGPHADDTGDIKYDEIDLGP